MPVPIDGGLTREIETSLAAGMERLTLAQVDARLKALGYRRELDMRAAGVARNLTTGNMYPSVSFGIAEVDTGMSAFHFKARRDANFKALQAMRYNTFAVIRGAYLGL